MNLISVKCRETSKYPLHHPHFPGHSPDLSTRPSSFWNIPHSHRSKVPMPICRTRHTHLTENIRGEHCCPQSSPPIPLLNPSPSLPGTQSRSSSRSWAGNHMFSSVNWGVLISQSKTKSWAFISDLEGKVLPEEQHANPLVGAEVWTEPGGGGTGQLSAKWNKGLLCWDVNQWQQSILLGAVGWRISLWKCRLFAKTQGTWAMTLRKQWGAYLWTCMFRVSIWEGMSISLWFFTTDLDRRTTSSPLVLTLRISSKEYHEVELLQELLHNCSSQVTCWRMLESAVRIDPGNKWINFQGILKSKEIAKEKNNIYVVQRVNSSVEDNNNLMRLLCLNQWYEITETQFFLSGACSTVILSVSLSLLSLSLCLCLSVSLSPSLSLYIKQLSQRSFWEKYSLETEDSMKKVWLCVFLLSGV